MAATISFVNGIPCRHLPIADRGLAYGHGLFETARVYQRKIPLWEWHKKRLLADAPKLGIMLDSLTLDRWVEQSLNTFFADTHAKDAVIKITVTAGESGRGYFSAAKSIPSCVIQFFPFNKELRQQYQLQICQYRLPVNPVLAGIKHLNRLDQVLAAKELEGDKDGLLLDTEGRVVEALSSNLFCFSAGRWLTPALSRAGVNGVLRRYLIEKLMPDLSLPVNITDISLEELREAEEIFCCNAIHGIRPVAAIVGLRDWAVAPETSALKVALAEKLPCFSD